MSKSKKQYSLILIVAFALITLLPACRMHFGNRSDSNLKVFQEKTFNTEPGKILKMKVHSSDVVIKTWDKPEVYVKVSGNKKAVKEAEINYSSDDRGVDIEMEGEFHFGFFSQSMFMKFEIFVPASYDAQIKTSGGIIAVNALKGNLELRTSGGDVNLRDITGSITAKTSGGTISGKNIEGGSKLTTSGGDIYYDNFTGDLGCSTSGGTINLNGSDSKIKAGTSGGDITLVYSGVNKGIDLHTSGGSITIKVPADFSADMNLRTSGGTINCGLRIDNLEKASSSRLSGELNNGGNELTASTSGGDIRVSEKK